MDEKCDICGKKATVHLTQIVNGDVMKAELCDTCAQSKGLLSKDLSALPTELLKLAIPHTEHGPEDYICPACGFSVMDFKRIGRLGCPKCYEALEPVLNGVLATVHRTLEHKGKMLTKKHAKKRSQSELEADLQSAIREERYEDAAKLRDAIKHAQPHAAHEQQK